MGVPECSVCFRPDSSDQTYDVDIANIVNNLV
jgi:hypothetical protein